MDIHVVRPGDTLYELAYQYGVPMSRSIRTISFQILPSW